VHLTFQYLEMATTVSVMAGTTVAVVRLIVWLLGLLVAVRGSRTEDRAIVLQSYLCHPHPPRVVPAAVEPMNVTGHGDQRSR
jgi:hypothetical protein